MGSVFYFIYTTKERDLKEGIGCGCVRVLGVEIDNLQLLKSITIISDEESVFKEFVIK